MIETLLSKHWHHLPVKEALDLLDTNEKKGLDSFEVENRQDRFGLNVLTQKKSQGPIARFLFQFHQPLIYILLAATIVTAFFHEWVDSSVIFGVVFINAIVGFIQEAKALRAIEALKGLMTCDATVLRAAAKKRIGAEDLVPGDIVFLQSGDKVSADLRLLRVRELQIDESMLTGESVPVRKTAECLEHDTVLADRKNMAYSGTLVTYGTCVGVAVATGDNTEIGKISKLISATETLTTPLTRKIESFSAFLVYVILSMGVLTFLIGMLHGKPWLDMFMAAVALAVGAIPEGLPAVVTITLAIGVSRMAKRNAIIRKLPAVETLGSTAVICSDKTGTLTQNQMTVQEIMAGAERYSVSGIGYTPEGELRHAENNTALMKNHALNECLKAGLLCNDTTLSKSESGWRVEGDPTEGALIVSAGKAGLVMDSMAKECLRFDAIPFESQQQFMATLHRTGKDKRGVIYLKGSVESLLPRCENRMESNGHLTSINEKVIHEHVEIMTNKGMRVLAFAFKEVPATKDSITHEDVAEGLVFLGIQGMIDPPRSEAIKAVQACYRAGIQVKMITGDHAGTAASIASQIGLMDRTEQQHCSGVLSGKEMTDMSDHDLIEAVNRTAVFARVAPEQKLRLVEALQSRGNVVAMTGDGVNDAPALRRADIGVAMGITGTEVSKEAADMVLTDDNFATIEAAVEEGRGVFDNLVKFITWVLPTSIGEGLVVMAAVIAGVTLPILPVQILWVNMTTAILLGLMLAFEPKEPGIMNKPPRDPEMPILTRPLIERIFMVGFLMLAGAFGLFNWVLHSGGSLEQARTVAVNVFVMVELIYLFNCRSLTKSIFSLGVFSNPWTIIGPVGMILLQLFYTYHPFMNRFFYSVPISPLQWVWIWVVAFSVYFIVGIDKWLRKRLTTER